MARFADIVITSITLKFFRILPYQNTVEVHSEKREGEGTMQDCVVCETKREQRVVYVCGCVCVVYLCMCNVDDTFAAV